MKKMDINKRLKYENNLFYYIMADAMRFKRRDELSRSFMVQFIDYDADYTELYFPEIYSEVKYDDVAISGTIEENEKSFIEHLLDEGSRERFHSLQHPDREKIIKEDKWCYSGMLFIEKDGSPHYLQYYHLYDIDDETGHLIAYAMTIFADVFKKEWEKNQRMAQRDQLTELFNRYMFHEIITQFQEEHEGKPAVIVELDADKFKMINDTYGHDAGDEALKAVTRRMQQVFYKRNQMVLFRLGGDEFAVFLKEMDHNQAKPFVEEMASRPIAFSLQGTEKPAGSGISLPGTEKPAGSAISLPGAEKKTEYTEKPAGSGGAGTCETEISFTVSVGYSEIRTEDTIETMLKRADAAMYSVKRAGGNGVKLEL